MQHIYSIYKHKFIYKICVVYDVYHIISDVKSNKKNEIFPNKMKVRRTGEEAENEGAMKWETNLC